MTNEHIRSKKDVTTTRTFVDSRVEIRKWRTSGYFGITATVLEGAITTVISFNIHQVAIFKQLYDYYQLTCDYLHEKNQSHAVLVNDVFYFNFIFIYDVYFCGLLVDIYMHVLCCLDMQAFAVYQKIMIYTVNFVYTYHQ